MQSTTPTIENTDTGRPYGPLPADFDPHQDAAGRPSRHPEDPSPAACDLPGGDVCPSRPQRGCPRRSASQRPENRPAHPGGLAVWHRPSLDWTVRGFWNRRRAVRHLAAWWWWMLDPLDDLTAAEARQLASGRQGRRVIIPRAGR